MTLWQGPAIAKIRTVVRLEEPQQENIEKGTSVEERAPKMRIGGRRKGGRGKLDTPSAWKIISRRREQVLTLVGQAQLSGLSRSEIVLSRPRRTSPLRRWKVPTGHGRVGIERGKREGLRGTAIFVEIEYQLVFHSNRE